MPLFRAAVPLKGDIRKDTKSVVSINSDRLAAVGGIGRVKGLSPALVEFHKAGIFDAVRLRTRDGKDHPLADMLLRREDHLDIVPIGTRYPMSLWELKQDVLSDRWSRYHRPRWILIETSGKKYALPQRREDLRQSAARLPAHRTGQDGRRCSD